MVLCMSIYEEYYNVKCGTLHCPPIRSIYEKLRCTSLSYVSIIEMVVFIIAINLIIIIIIITIIIISIETINISYCMCQR